MTSTEDRRYAVAILDEALSAGSRCTPACNTLHISTSTYRRWAQNPEGDRRPHAQRRTPSNALSEEERKQIIAICNSQEYSSRSPAQIVPALADNDVFIGSESMFYRVLHDENQQRYRGRASAPRVVVPPRWHTAERPNQIWTWDATYLRGPVKGLFYFLYMIIDIFSRKIVGWEVWEEELAEYANTLIDRAVLAEGCRGKLEVLHADNGSIQKAYALRAKLKDLGVEPSYSRPRVSNDNAYSESLFRTLKYRPRFPDRGFMGLTASREWVHAFTEWYNNVHRHSSIKFVAPAERHAGLDTQILARRKALYEAARAKNPNRWSKETRNWTPDTEVHLNRRKEENIRLIEA